MPAQSSPPGLSGTQLRRSDFWPPKLATALTRRSAATSRTWSFDLYRTAAVQEVRQLLPEEGVLVNAVGRDEGGSIVVFDVEFKVKSEPERSRLRALFIERFRTEEKLTLDDLGDTQIIDFSSLARRKVQAVGIDDAGRLLLSSNPVEGFTVSRLRFPARAACES
jgi:hypothetical protein